MDFYWLFCAWLCVTISCFFPCLVIYNVFWEFWMLLWGDSGFCHFPLNNVSFSSSRLLLQLNSKSKWYVFCGGQPLRSPLSTFSHPAIPFWLPSKSSLSIPCMNKFKYQPQVSIELTICRFEASLSAAIFFPEFLPLPHFSAFWQSQTNNISTFCLNSIYPPAT